MKVKLKRSLAALAILGVVAGGVAVTQVASAAPANMPIAGSVTLSGTAASTSITTVPNPALCPGPTTGTPSYTWSGFIAPQAADLATLQFTGSGVVGGFPMLPVTGAPYLNKPTADDGSIVGLDPFRITNYGGTLTSGVYDVGVACVVAGQVAVIPNGAGTTDDRAAVWATPITVTVSGTAVSYTVGAPPEAPVLEAAANVAVTATTATVDFTHAASTPGTTSYTATVSPSAGVTVAAMGAGAAQVQLSGLTTSTEYTVTLVANNGSPSPASNSVTFTPEAARQPAIVPTFTPGVGAGTVNIPSPSLLGAVTALPGNYTLVVTNEATAAAVGTPYTIGAVPGTVVTQAVPSLTAGTVYRFTVTANYASPDRGPAVAPFVTGTSNNAQVLQQRITVERPLGQLILTQRCGVNGDLEAVAADTGFPGFPTPLDSVGASTSQIGTSPDVTPNAPNVLFPTGAGSFADAFNDSAYNATSNPTGDADPRFNNYPFPSPATYPTECGVSLGSATIVTSGSLTGQYFQASGYINEVTVSDLRDTDLGWEVRGQMSDFVGTVSNTNVIDGDYLGWNPEVNFTTPVTGNGYLQTVAPGGEVLPGAGTTNTAGTGLGSGKRLAIATENLGLGVAQMDARLRILIPTTAKNDVYTGIMTFTVLDNDNATLGL